LAENYYSTRPGCTLLRGCWWTENDLQLRGVARRERAHQRERMLGAPAIPHVEAQHRQPHLRADRSLGNQWMGLGIQQGPPLPPASPQVALALVCRAAVLLRISASARTRTHCVALKGSVVQAAGSGPCPLLARGFRVQEEGESGGRGEEGRSGGKGGGGRGGGEPGLQHPRQQAVSSARS